MTGTVATVQSALDETARQLRAAGIDEARREARLLVGHALECDAVSLIAGPDTSPGRDGLMRLRELTGRRVRREPMSHLLGVREFWSLEFEVNADVLDPRPDSETLVQAALDEIADKDAPLRLLDLGTGSGCLVLALLSELPRAHGIGIDRSQRAVAVAARNARRLGLDGRAEFATGFWGSELTGPFDVILANPPYVATGDIDKLQPEIARYEPREALDGGVDGLSAYHEIAPCVDRLLASGGVASVELGAGQAIDVKEIFLKQGLDIRGLKYDLGRVGRCLVLRHDRQLTDTKNKGWNGVPTKLGCSPGERSGFKSLSPVSPSKTAYADFGHPRSGGCSTGRLVRVLYMPAGTDVLRGLATTTWKSHYETWSE